MVDILDDGKTQADTVPTQAFRRRRCVGVCDDVENGGGWRAAETEQEETNSSRQDDQGQKGVVEDYPGPATETSHPPIEAGDRNGSDTNCDPKQHAAKLSNLST